MLFIHKSTEYYDWLISCRYFLICEDGFLQKYHSERSEADGLIWLSHHLEMRFIENGSGVGVIYDRRSERVIGQYEWGRSGLEKRTVSDILPENIRFLAECNSN